MVRSGSRPLAYRSTSRFLGDEDTNARCTVKNVDGLFLKDVDMGIGCLVRSLVDAMFDRCNQ